MTGAQEPQRGPTFPLPIGGRPAPLPRNTLSEHLADYADPHRVRDLVPASRSGEGAPEALEADKPGDIYFDTATSELYVMREVAGVPSWLPVGSSETTAAAEAAKESADAAKASVDALVAESAGFARTSDLEGVAMTSDLSSLAKASDLEGVARTTDLSSLAKTTDLSSLAKTSDLDGVAKTSDLSSLAKASDLDGVAKTSDLSSLAKASDLSPLAKASDLSPLAKASDLDGVAMTSDLSSLAKTADLEGVAKTADLSSLAKASAVVEVGEKVGQICTVLGGDTDGDTVQAIVKKIHECAGERDSGGDGYGKTIHEMLDELYYIRLGGSSLEWYEIHEAVSWLRGYDGSSGIPDNDITWLTLVQRVKETLEKVDALTTKIDSANAELETTA